MKTTDCISIIIASLQNLINGDIVGVCRNQRISSSFINRTRKPEDSEIIQLMLNSTESIMEICCDIATRTRLTLWQKCELEVLLQELINEKYTETENYIKHAIVDCLKEMSADDSDKDGAYNYLRLLQNLRSVIIANSKACIA